jgi:hypothetical protein
MDGFGDNPAEFTGLLGRERRIAMQTDPMSGLTRAFNLRDLGALLDFFGTSALFEMPLLGQRLVGREEIRAGLERMFEIAESCSIELMAVRHAATVSMGEGRFHARLHRDPEGTSSPMALVVERSGSAVSRLSIYLDTRGRRLWADGPIFGNPDNGPRAIHG